MAVSVTVLASGSRGNSTLITCGATRILVDAGLSCRETRRRLKLAGEDPGSLSTLSGVVISHEHSDHVNGLATIAKKFDVPAYMTGSTYNAWYKQWRDAGYQTGDAGPALAKRELFRSGQPFTIGSIEVMPFTIPHDAADPVGFTFTAEGIKIAIVTDLGYMPPSVRENLRDCDLILIESNHDLEMLRIGPYPWSVKQRVLSRVGHLSNDALADFLTSDYDGGAAFLILGHISGENNHPEVARRAAEQALERRPRLLANRLLVASQEEPLETIRF